MDTAQGRPGDPLEYTAAAGGAAYILGPGDDALAAFARDLESGELSFLEAYFDEKASYARELDDQGEGTDQIEDKGDYHIMDCERYLWSYLGEQHGAGESVVVPPVDPFNDLSWDW